MPRTKLNQPLSEKIQHELRLIEYSDTIGGALTNLEVFFSKLQKALEGTPTLFYIEQQIAMEDQSSFENLQKSVDWVQKKILRLLPAVLWEKDSEHLRLVHSSLKFQVLPLSQGGYLGHLFFQLRHIASDVLQKPRNRHLFKGWAMIERLPSGELSIVDWILPEYLKIELDKPSIEEQIYQWQEKADISLLTLYRFLKLLSQYRSFQPLALNPTTELSDLPNNLQELEQRCHKAHVGYYLSLFRSSDTKKHPMTLEALYKLIKRFICMLERETSETPLKGPALKKYMTEAAKKYCVKELIEHVLTLAPEELKRFNRYGFEVFEFLQKKAKESNQPFADYISKTMIKEDAGPEANRSLLMMHKKVWHPIPPKSGGVQSLPL